MNATIKATREETVIRLENGCVVHEKSIHGRVQAEAWAPGGERLYQGQWMAKALQLACTYTGAGSPYADAP